MYWLSSKETMKRLKVSSCKLMHKRLAGELKFKKVGNAYFYSVTKAVIEEKDMNKLSSVVLVSH